jgi:DNA-binding SARP family transcriptional activator
VAVAALLDAVWGDPVPDRAEHTLQQHVSTLRKAIGAAAVATRSPGYMLDGATVDVDAFEGVAAEGLEAAAGGRWDQAAATLHDALALWRGPALADARDTARLEAAAVRLDEQRLVAVETRSEARLQCGHARELVAELEHLVAEHPLRERFRALLMLALYRSGRQADALAAYRDARRVLIEELGIEPGPELRELEQAILDQRAELDRGATGRVAEVYATFRAGTRSDAGRLELPDGQAVLLVEGTTLIGREPAAPVRLVDNRVSRRHAEIEARAGRCVLRDLGSTNGTTINGEPVGERVLDDGDIVGVGGAVELRFHGIES